MSGKKLPASLTHEKFRHRSHELVRIEALSDAVFAFSVSLLVASLEVPQTFEELKGIVMGALPFFTTVTILFLFWYQQYIFFRHYGLNDLKTILLNLAYLAIILFYVYPLKFLFSVLISSWTGIHLFPKATEKGLIVLPASDFPQLIMLFSVGYVCIWMILYLLHKRALQFANEAELNFYELQYTRREIRGALWNALIGVVAFLMALAGTELSAGICYLFIPVVLFVNEQLFRHQLKKKNNVQH